MIFFYEHFGRMCVHDRDLILFLFCYLVTTHSSLSIFQFSEIRYEVFYCLGYCILSGEYEVGNYHISL